MSTVLVLGASGATGRLLVQQLLDQQVKVKAVVRDCATLPEAIRSSSDCRIIEAEIARVSALELGDWVADCEVVCSCLGHRMTFKGLFGRPRELVTDAVKKVAEAVNTRDPAHPLRLVLMNTSGNSNRDIPEIPPLSQRLVVSIIRALLPPHADNEKAADYLRLEVADQHPNLEWVAVRPDGLIDESDVSAYDVSASPIRNVIFDAGKTSRINVANFMMRLALEPDLWEKWQGRMPVIYNRG